MCGYLVIPLFFHMKSSVCSCHQQAIINNEAEEPERSRGFEYMDFVLLMSYKKKSTGKKI